MPAKLAQTNIPQNSTLLSTRLDQELFTSPPPAVSTAEAESIANEMYGLVGKATSLNAERDANFLVETAFEKFVLKISNAAESKARTDLNNAVLSHLESHSPGLPVPRLVRTVNNKVACNSDVTGESVVRLLTYLEGAPIGEVSEDQRPLTQLGACLGSLNECLSSFLHPSMHLDLIWNSSRVDNLSVLTEHLEIPKQRKYFERLLKIHHDLVVPRLQTLRHQIIHNDANLGNVLVSQKQKSRICGIFDFGDVVFAPAINELAVCAAYHIQEGGDAYSVLSALAVGYHQNYPLSAEDILVLIDLIRARLITTVLISHWRANLFPTNRSYILRNNEAAWRSLLWLDRLDVARLNSELLIACNLES